jgi:dTDP-4-amino-4,6-dideoxygalactose transaminase
MATCGQGGLLLGDDPRLEERARDLTDYDNRPEYRVRHNYQLTDIQAALARRQWSALDGFVEARRALADRYDRGIDFERAGRLGGKAGPPAGSAPGRPCYFRYPVDVGGAAALGRIRERLAAAGIDSKPPVHRPLHRYLGFPDQEFPHASRLQQSILSIPIYPSLKMEEADRVIEALNDAMKMENG